MVAFVVMYISNLMGMYYFKITIIAAIKNNTSCFMYLRTCRYLNMNDPFAF